MSLQKKLKMKKNRLSKMKKELKTRDESTVKKTPTRYGGAKNYADLTEVSNADLMSSIHSLERKIYGERRTDFTNYFSREYIEKKQQTHHLIHVDL